MAGRRPGGPDTRGEIVAAARESFASKGFDRTSIRGVARDAGVDAALVHHYFDGKEDLFIAALELPIDPRVIATELMRGPLDELGARIVTTFLSVWETDAGQARMKAMLRGAVTSEEVAKMVREGITRMIFTPVAAVLGTPDATQRVALVASQLMGLALARYVIELEPLASATPDEVITRIAPTLQGYLTR
ncbi:TetR/AcrR family transcriptional regulator [Kribbella deserti]|uniref:TetR family transcriptional regulator n=1 Tax=Kribbella deserti TaxID=1926257 RepID=A0ABV6QPF4_9ACTN